MKKLRHSYALDDKDITIIRMLLKDGRTTDAELAQAIGRTRPIATVRRQAMEKAGVIQKYFPVIDWSIVAESNDIRREMANEKSTDNLH